MSSALDSATTNRERILFSRWVFLCVAVITLLVALGARYSNRSPAANVENELDRQLQKAAALALGDRRGTVIIMDAQTGRIRAVVNPNVAFEQSFSPGSTVKPFTALAALRSSVINNETRTLCREEYADSDFHTVCAHPRDLPPLNPVDAIAYSCNYYFGKVGEKLSEPVFASTLAEFGFGKKTGVESLEAEGKLVRTAWRPEHAMGETDSLQVTPIQLLNAYTALVNGGHLLTPHVGQASGFRPQAQAEIPIKDEHRRLVVQGMRGAVRYGTAETAHLYSLPSYVFGKTGTAEQLNAFRTHGWFIGFAAADSPNNAEVSPNDVKLAVLVLLMKAHGSDAAEISRSIFETYARFGETTESAPAITQPPGRARADAAGANVRIHLVKENTDVTVSLDEYVRGVLAAEGSTEEQPEALRALAIASRTYALKNLGRHSKDGYDFCTTTHCQRYVATDDVAERIAAAVDSTRGEVLRDEADQLVESYFSASCGGATANMKTLWNTGAPSYLAGVRDDYCATEAHHEWTDVIAQADMLKALQSDERSNVGKHLHDVHVLKQDETGRAQLLLIKGDRQVTVNGWDFKIIVGRALGWNVLKSSRFEVSRSGSNFIFRGSGFGHGLGLCQAGAHVMATRGANHQQILAKYFPGTHVSNISFRTSADLFWSAAPIIANHPVRSPNQNRQTISSENFRVTYPASLDTREVNKLLRFLDMTRDALTARVSVAGLNARVPKLEIFINETTGDFVGRTGQPAWAAAATNGNRIEIQPLPTLKRRRILETTLRHELVHALIETMGRGRTPRWLAEGLAIHFAGEGTLVSRYARAEKLMPRQIDERLVNSRSAEEIRAAYAAAYFEVKRLINEKGEAAVWRSIIT